MATMGNLMGDYSNLTERMKRELRLTIAEHDGEIAYKHRSDYAAEWDANRDIRVLFPYEDEEKSVVKISTDLDEIWIMCDDGTERPADTADLLNIAAMFAEHIFYMEICDRMSGYKEGDILTLIYDYGRQRVVFEFYNYLIVSEHEVKIYWKKFLSSRDVYMEDYPSELDFVQFLINAGDKLRYANKEEVELFNIKKEEYN